MTLKAEMKTPAWLDRLDQLPEQVARGVLAQAQGDLQESLRRNAQKGGPRGLRVRSGRLLRSIRAALKPTPGGAELDVSMAEYGWIHNRGATITAHSGGRLRMFIPGVGWRTAMRSVLPARGWIDDAVDETRAKLPRYLNQAVQKAVRP